MKVPNSSEKSADAAGVGVVVSDNVKLKSWWIDIDGWDQLRLQARNAYRTGRIRSADGADPRDGDLLVRLRSESAHEELCVLEMRLDPIVVGA